MNWQAGKEHARPLLSQNRSIECWVNFMIAVLLSLKGRHLRAILSYNDNDDTNSLACCMYTSGIQSQCALPHPYFLLNLSLPVTLLAKEKSLWPSSYDTVRNAPCGCMLPSASRDVLSSSPSAIPRHRWCHRADRNVFIKKIHNYCIYRLSSFLHD
jgi:hypothetical protein